MSEATSGVLQHPAYRCAHAGYLLHADRRRTTYAINGSRIRKIAPLRFSTSICPLCALTIVRAIESPMPMPWSLVEKNGSNIFVAASGGTPGPVSSTDLGKPLVLSCRHRHGALSAWHIQNGVHRIENHV